MINKIETSQLNSSNISTHKNNKGREQNPSFKGLGALALQGIQACERMPMINVAVVDMLSAILPRTIVESMTNWFAGFEAFRRESSGLVVNCLIPSLVTLGLAKCINPAFMPKGVSMSRCWADSTLIDKAAEYYSQSSSEDKVKESLKNILGNIEGSEGKNHKVLFKDVLKDDLDKYAQRLVDISRSNQDDSAMRKEVKKLASEIVEKTHL